MADLCRNGIPGESAAEATEEMMEKYLEEGELSEKRSRLVSRATDLANEIIHFGGSAFKNKTYRPFSTQLSNTCLQWRLRHEGYRRPGRRREPLWKRVADDDALLCAGVQDCLSRSLVPDSPVFTPVSPSGGR